MTERQLKKLLPGLLREKSLSDLIAQLRKYPAKICVSALLSGVYETDEQIKWPSISALGVRMNDLANEDMEEARIIMRRILWSLNEESGGIGWGMPEALGEIMAINSDLAKEYGQMLISYMREENFLEHPVMQRGLLWGVGRLAQERPEIIHTYDGEGYMEIYLESPDDVVLGLVSRNFGILKTKDAAHWIKQFYQITTPIRLYEGGNFIDTSVGELAQEAMAKIEA